MNGLPDEKCWKIPRSWNWVPFYEVVDISSNLVRADEISQLPHIAPNNIQSGSAKLLPFNSVAEDGVFSAKHHFFPGQVLYSKIRPYLRKAVLVEFEGGCSADMYPLTASRGIISKFLLNWVVSKDFTDFAIRLQGRTVLPKINQNALNQTPLPLPPLAEQKRIVAKLDALSAKSARARTELARIEILVSRYKQAVLGKAFSGELTKEWRRIHVSKAAEDIEYSVAQERTEIRKERGLAGVGSNRSVPQHSIELRVIPDNWIWLNFDQCSYDLTVGHVGPMKDRYVDSGIPFLRSLNVKPNRIEMKNIAYIDATFHAELKKSTLKTGDLVIVRTGEPGVAAVVPEDMKIANCSDLVICRLVDAVDPNYAAFYMNSGFARSTVGDMQVGVAQQHFNVGAMSKMPVPIPSLQEQHEIVRRIDSAFARIDRVAAEAKRALALLDRLDEAILAKAFRGELVRQDENDEPASVLLDRIRAERAAAPKQKHGRKA